MEPKPPSNRIWDAQPARSRRLLDSILRSAATGEIRVKARVDSLTRKRGKKPRGLTVDAVVDTGAVMMLLPQDAVTAIGLEIVGSIVVQLANDQKIELPRTGGFRLTVAGRDMFTDCLVGPPGCEALIGQLVMERLDLIPDPLN